MNRVTKTERERPMRRQRRVRWRRCMHCTFTVIWVTQVLFGLVMADTSAQPLLNPALLGTVAPVLPVRRRRNSRQPTQAAASYARFSSLLQDDASIETQEDRCNQQSAADGLPIDARFQYADKAVSGTKLHRNALDKLLAEAEAGRFSRVYFFSLSRLARESVIGLALIKRLVYVYKVRVISVTEGLDSDREGWETLASILFMQHERYVKELSANTFRGQKGNIANGYSNGDFCFGYSSEPVPGTDTTGRGRHRKPRMRYVVDPVEAQWVRRIFHWFVVERRSLRWITKELNRLQAPKDHRSSTPKWHHQMLARLIRNTKLIGLWPWGRMQNERDPESGDIRQEERPAEERQQWLRTLPELQIIGEVQFLQAQQILAKNAQQCAKGRNKEGEFTAQQGEGSVTNPLHLLAGLVVCAVCARKFHVGGAHGKYLFCPGYADGTCTCRTMLRRDLAERLILGQIGQRILNNAIWLEKVLDYTLAAWEQLQATVPNELRDAEAAMAKVKLAIRRYLDLIERHDTTEPDVLQRLAELRAEREQLESKLEQLQQLLHSMPARPTAAWVAEQMQHLHEVLVSSTPAAANALRNLAGGSIVVEEVHTDGRKRCHLRGQFRLHVGIVIEVGRVGDTPAVTDGDQGEPITIDFVDIDPLDAKAEQVKALWDEGKLGKQIAAELDCSRAQVTKLLKHWAKLHRAELPNGYARRMQIAHQSNPPLYQQVAERAYELHERGLLIAEIASERGCDINTATKAIRFWCESHGLPWVDGRTRRKGLERKCRTEQDGDRDGETPNAPLPS